MAITSTTRISPVAASTLAREPKPPPTVSPAAEPPFKGLTPVQPDGWHASRAAADSAIVVDFGSSTVRAGWSFDADPRLVLPPVASRYRDRKLGKACQFVGYDAYVDATSRGQMRHAFDGGTGVVGNWDVVEGVLDYVFVKLGVERLDRGMVVTEALANLGYSRRMMSEILFECYNAPSVAYGIDSLFAYRHNGGTDGLVVSAAHSSTHVVPVLGGRAVLASCARLNWGGHHAADYLMKLLRLKYPTFPSKMTEVQMDEMVRAHCYVSQDYDAELARCLDWTGLEDRDVVVQYPYTEQLVVEKSAEELARIAERKKESGRRLQEQAAKMRLEKLLKKEQELEYYRGVQARVAGETTKKEVRRLLDGEGLRDEAALEKTVRELEKSVKKARNRDLGVEEAEEPPEEAAFPLLEVPDEQLDEAGLKEKRHQKLMKANVDARARAKAEKEAEKARAAEERRLDDERREAHLDDWLEERRQAREEVLRRMKERERLKSDSGRKSLASQMRMRTLANLAADGPKKRRRGGGGGGGGEDNDTFGMDDSDWGVYRSVLAPADASDEEEEDLAGTLRQIEAQLLEHDAAFTEQHTHAAQSDWRGSLVHAFLRGGWAYEETAAEAHQVHLNVERVRVPEVVFQPGIAGVDQAGVVEIAGEVVQRFAAGERARMLRDVFLTGGGTLFRGFQERFERELRTCLEAGSEVRLRRARDALADGWRGAAGWAGSAEWRAAAVSREEYAEKGGDYLKEHSWGNSL